MSMQPDLISSLKALPCFDAITAIDCLAGGLSQTAFKVSTLSQVYFVKKLNTETANTELSCTHICANSSELEPSVGQLSPDVHYFDSDWLVTSFIHGDTLAYSKLADSDKTASALRLMVDLHQLPLPKSNQAIYPLNTNRSYNRLLIAPANFLTQHRVSLDKTCNELTAMINSLSNSSTNSNVLCHGDINFTNILVDNDNKAWLLDFECAHIAPAEFDLAMFIAVNSIPTEKVADIIAMYHDLAANSVLDKQLVNCYLLYSYLINGLWYFDNINSLDSSCPMIDLGESQWSAFDRFAEQEGITITDLTTLIA